MVMMTKAEEKRLADYERESQDQRKRETEKAALISRPLSVDHIFTALEESAKTSIREANQDIGVLLKCADKFKDMEITQRAKQIISVLKYQIEEDHESIIRWRTEKKSIRV
jgi:hypothetical protein